MFPTDEKPLLKSLLAETADLELAVLVGSRAQGTAHAESDWDIAIRWEKRIPPFERLGKTETLRRALAHNLNVAENKIDLIDLTNAGLAMRAVAAEEGVVLKGEDNLAWNHFLLKTWRELEDYYWDLSHAA